MRYKGKIVDWQDEKGFGFITPNSGGKKVFVHINAFTNKLRRPIANEIVTYALETDANGRIRADSVLFAGERLPKTSATKPGKLPLFFVMFFIVALVVMAYNTLLPSIILWLYGLMSLLAISTYALDKAAARNHGWRTPESSLHLMALAGGWPGAWFAQRVLRHKSSKQAFQRTFWVTVILNCMGLGWLVSPYGGDVLGLVYSLDAFLGA